MPFKLSAGKLCAGLVLSVLLLGAASADDLVTYKVVVNNQKQYSCWRLYKENPLGWRDVGVKGTKQECIDHAKQHR